MINNNDNNQRNQPVIPLPNPGEGGPVYPGDEISDENKPVIPLPNPGEGGPVYPGNEINNGNNILSGIIGTIITTYPRPNAPCRFCNAGTSNYGLVRFLNAASGYNPFIIYLNSDVFANPLSYAEVTEYEKVTNGMQRVTVMGENGYIYIQKQVMIPQNQAATIAIMNTESGLDLMVIDDVPCSKPLRTGCIRACNLSVNSGPLNIVIGQRYITFNNVAYMDVTEFKNIWPGDYNFYISRNYNNRPMMNNNALISSMLTVAMNVSYTIYIFNWNLSSPDAIRALIVEEH